MIWDENNYVRFEELCVDLLLIDKMILKNNLFINTVISDYNG